MRSPADRLRHAICFELGGILLATPLGVMIFGLNLDASAVIIVGSATIAMLWTYLYNLGFDHAMQARLGTTEKTLPLRILHAVLFELGLLVMLMPLIAWYLDISLWQALLMDLSFAAFYMVYAFIYNWLYDRIFPLPAWQGTRHSDS